jgi:hypothetical protein
VQEGRSTTMGICLMTRTPPPPPPPQHHPCKRIFQSGVSRWLWISIRWLHNASPYVIRWLQPYCTQSMSSLLLWLPNVRCIWGTQLTPARLVVVSFLHRN